MQMKQLLLCYDTVGLDMMLWGGSPQHHSVICGGLQRVMDAALQSRRPEKKLNS